MNSNSDHFAVADLLELSEYVCDRWSSASDLDWSVKAGSLDWTCTKTADHAVDCVFAAAFFLASRRQDSYPDMGADYSVGPDAQPEQLIQTLRVAARVLAAVIAFSGTDVRAAIFMRPQVITASREDFAPRGAMELILHAHDICAGLGVPFEPPAHLCQRLRNHTHDWPMWSGTWNRISDSDDPWLDLLQASARRRYD